MTLRLKTAEKYHQFESPTAQEDTYRIFPSISTQEPILSQRCSRPRRSRQPFSFGRIFGPFEVPESEHRSRCTMPLGHQFSNPHYRHYDAVVDRTPYFLTRGKGVH